MPFRIRSPKKGEKKQKDEPIKKEIDPLETLIKDPKYYLNLPENEKKDIPDIQQKLLYEIPRLPLELVLDQRKTIATLLQEAEESKKQGKYGEAANLYRQAATLGLLRPEIRLKIDPNATDVKLEDIIAYLELTKELGYPISYDAVIKYTRIAREITSDKLGAYQPKAVEKKKETGEIARELAKK